MCCPVLGIVHRRDGGCRCGPGISRGVIIVSRSNGRFTQVSVGGFLRRSSGLLGRVGTTDSESFRVPRARGFVARVNYSGLGTPSGSGTSVRVIVRSLHAGVAPLLNFDVGSRLKDTSALLGTKAPAGVACGVINGRLDSNSVRRVGTVGKRLLQVQTVFSVKYALRCDSVRRPAFGGGLLFLSDYVPRFITSYLLVSDLPGSGSSVGRYITRITGQGPFGFDNGGMRAFCTRGVGILLLSTTLKVAPTGR